LADIRSFQRHPMAESPETTGTQCDACSDDDRLSENVRLESRLNNEGLTQVSEDAREAYAENFRLSAEIHVFKDLTARLAKLGNLPPDVQALCLELATGSSSSSSGEGRTAAERAPESVPEGPESDSDDLDVPGGGGPATSQVWEYPLSRHDKLARVHQLYGYDLRAANQDLRAANKEIKTLRQEIRRRSTSSISTCAASSPPSSQPVPSQPPLSQSSSSSSSSPFSIPVAAGNGLDVTMRTAGVLDKLHDLQLAVERCETASDREGTSGQPNPPENEILMLESDSAWIRARNVMTELFSRPY